MAEQEKEKKKGGFFKWVGIIVTVFIGLGIVGSFLGEEDGATRSENGATRSETAERSNGPSTNSSSRAPASRTEGVVGDAFEGRLIAARIDALGVTDRVGGEYLQENAARGAKFVTVRYSYQNISNGPIGSFRSPTIRLISGAGTEFSEDGGASAMYAVDLGVEENAFSDLNPGIEYDGVAVFEIAESMLSEAGWAVKVELDRGEFYIPFTVQ